MKRTLLPVAMLALAAAVGLGAYSLREKELRTKWMNDGVTNKTQQVILVFGGERDNIKIELGIREDGAVVGRVAE